MDLRNIKNTKTSSHASQLGRRRSDEATIDVIVSGGGVVGEGPPLMPILIWNMNVGGVRLGCNGCGFPLRLGLASSH